MVEPIRLAWFGGTDMTAQLRTVSKLSIAAAGCLAVAAWASPAAAVFAGPPLETAFAAWKAKHRITTTSLVVDDGTTISFDANANTPTRIASASKAITAVCVGTLVRDKKLSFGTPLITAIPRYFGQYGFGFLGFNPQQIIQQHQWRLSLPVALLMTHGSGIVADGTQNAPAANWTADLNAPLLAGGFNTLLNPPGTFFYNNVNYTTLAMVIEQATGETYENYCRRAVLAPAGVTTARIAPSVRLFGAAGGWEISPLDYMRFMNRYMGSRASAPVLPMTAWPGVTNLKPGQSAYGPGANVRAYQAVRYTVTWIAGRQILTPVVYTEYNTWHSGALGRVGASDSFGSYFVTYGDRKKSWFATFSPRPSDAAYAELDQVMGAAAAK